MDTIFRNPARHDEWLIDESVEETFPASDATTPVQPGSLVGSRYPASARAATSTLMWTLVLCSIAAVALLWRVREGRRSQESKATAIITLHGAPVEG